MASIGSEGDCQRLPDICQESRAEKWKDLPFVRTPEYSLYFCGNRSQQLADWKWDL